MPTQNVKQTLKFRALQIMSTDLTEEQQKLVNSILSGEDFEKEPSIEALMASLTKKQKNELTSMGVESLLDKLDVHLAVGNLLYDCYRSQVPMPVAPFPKAAEESRRQNFAKILDNETLPTDIPMELINAAEEVMNDNSKWTRLNVWGWIDVSDDKKRFIPLTGMGVNFYTKVVNATCELLLAAKNPPEGEVAAINE